MSPVLRSEDAMAFEAAAHLDLYEEQLLSCARAGPEPGDLARVDLQLRRVCRCCMHLPGLSVACVTLLLSHYRLLAGALRPAPLAAGTLRAHQACIAALRRQCRALFLAAHRR